MELTLRSVRLALHFCRVFRRLPLGIPSRSLKADASMNTEKSEPKPCKRFSKRFVWNARFLARLPCEECEATISYLVNEANTSAQGVFGLITSTSVAPRIIQLGIKLIF
jgi:hypothetical protein